MALYSHIDLIWCGAMSRIDRFKPAFWATFLPGSSIVPAADAVIFLTFKSSSMMAPKFLAA
jgi:hypothetical protein